MIAYFDTSAIVPLVIGEPGSTACTRLWNEATRVMSVRLLYPEARAALAKAHRMDRLTRRQLTAAVADLEVIMTEVDHAEITADLARDAGELADVHGLRGYDAVHLAAAVSAREPDLVVATGDHGMAAAARALGISVALTA
ncbi:MAG: type II toxin-antitoxin system VapC family toxin [Acidimicrobiia bacterium]|nr:type II toxin-antitoxin system VapC family toxin [Acidimicrobiia bacterium]